MSAFGHHLFDTAIGRCGIAWGPRGILAIGLPEASEARLRTRILQRAPNAPDMPPPPAIADAIAEIVDHLAGGRRDFAGLVLDMDGIAEFERGVYAVARAIPPGGTLTYGGVAERLGDKQLARAVGGALGRNPFTIVVPCHRVLAANGQRGGFSAHGGVDTKLRLLDIEGATLPQPPVTRRAAAKADDMPRLPFL